MRRYLGAIATALLLALPQPSDPVEQKPDIEALRLLVDESQAINRLIVRSHAVISELFLANDWLVSAWRWQGDYSEAGMHVRAVLKSAEASIIPIGEAAADLAITAPDAPPLYRYPDLVLEWAAEQPDDIGMIAANLRRLVAALDRSDFDTANEIIAATDGVMTGFAARDKALYEALVAPLPPDGTLASMQRALYQPNRFWLEVETPATDAPPEEWDRYSTELGALALEIASEMSALTKDARAALPRLEQALAELLVSATNRPAAGLTGSAAIALVGEQLDQIEGMAELYVRTSGYLYRVAADGFTEDLDLEGSAVNDELDRRFKRVGALTIELYDLLGEELAK